MAIDRDYEDLRGDGRIVLFLREGKKPKYHVRLKVPEQLRATSLSRLRLQIETKPSDWQ